MFQYAHPAVRGRLVPPTQGMAEVLFTGPAMGLRYGSCAQAEARVPAPCTAAVRDGTCQAMLSSSELRLNGPFYEWLHKDGNEDNTLQQHRQQRIGIQPHIS